MLFYSLIELRLIDKIKKKYSDALHWHLVLIETKQNVCNIMKRLD
jgi:hypothetical protein